MIKLKSIENTLNCWRARNLSLVGKICVIKTLLLPQLLYFFSVLCIKLPNKFFRQFMCNDYSNLYGMVAMIGSK